MECTGRLKDISRNWLTKKWEVRFEVDEDITGGVGKLTDRLLTITAKAYRKRRSLDSNAYAWVLMQKIAETIHSDKWSVYLIMLERYSRAFTHIIVRPEIASRVAAEWRTVKNLGPITVNGQTGIQLQCYFGSSTFNAKEMGVFLDGIIGECRQMGIETLPPCELERMKQEWGVTVQEAQARGGYAGKEVRRRGDHV